MKAIIFVCLLVGSGFASSLRAKRSVVNFADMIQCTTGRSSLDYNGYGCWCGYGGSGTPVDAVDQCCRTHDTCYNNLEDNETCSKLQLYVQGYSFSKSGCQSSSATITCGSGNACAEGLCACDKAAALCFQDEDYNSEYNGYDSDNC